jgi:hypothetical protein
MKSKGMDSVFYNLFYTRTCAVSETLGEKGRKEIPRIYPSLLVASLMIDPTRMSISRLNLSRFLLW